MNAQRCDDDWVQYVVRNMFRKVLEGRTFTLTGPLQAEAKELSESCRAIIRSAATEYRIVKVVERSKTTGLESMTSLRGGIDVRATKLPAVNLLLCRRCGGARTLIKIVAQPRASLPGDRRTFRCPSCMSSQTYQINRHGAQLLSSD